ncbi:MAG: hypothetical protein KBG82_09005 [Spirochaetes bacterium]|jgi:hypothetical protein|nr:hypothetical protein [Spirochaetota bacterium]MBP8992102.1 hypothetical protein [Spirochaetota bacterium]HQQ20094.1 hypothetical protein [Exilispira sp.]
MARIKEILERIACSLEIIANNLSPDNLKDENVINIVSKANSANNKLLFQMEIILNLISFLK